MIVSKCGEETIDDFEMKFLFIGYIIGVKLYFDKYAKFAQIKGAGYNGDMLKDHKKMLNKFDDVLTAVFIVGMLLYGLALSVR